MAISHIIRVKAVQGLGCFIATGGIVGSIASSLCVLYS